jgi:LmbE family N-acetylglucosaminyl deacetylase
MNLDIQTEDSSTYQTIKSVAVIVAHPDDETLWAGGLILSNPSAHWFIVCLSRKSDNERATKFYKALKDLGSEGIMGDLDDGPTQEPVGNEVIEALIMDLLPQRHFDLIITHNPKGEYTRHLRHEETSNAVMRLWNSNKIDATQFWTFAYEDGNKAYYPRPIQTAFICQKLWGDVWFKKYRIITETYGFATNSWEAFTTPQSEAFQQILRQKVIQYVVN